MPASTKAKKSGVVREEAFMLPDGDKRTFLRMCSNEKQRTALEKRDGFFSAGMLPRYKGGWYFVQKNESKPYNDAGGKRAGDERVIDTAHRECFQEIGIEAGNIRKVHAIYEHRCHTVIIVEVDKEPVAVEEGSSVMRVEVYDADVKGRLNIWEKAGLPKKLKSIEDAEIETVGSKTLDFSDLFHDTADSA